MPKRNDPCPCGSGRKYKACCMRRDQISESRRLSTLPVDRVLFEELVELAQAPRFSADLTAAFQLYWGGAYPAQASEELSVDESQRMFEWFVHDYRSSVQGQRIIDIYAETTRASLLKEARPVLQAWQSSSVGLFRVVGTDGAEERLELYDLLRQRDLVALSGTMARNAQRGDLLVGRLYDYGEIRRLSILTMLLPSAIEPEIVDYASKAFERYAADHFQATWDQFLRDNGHIFAAFLCSPKAASMRRLVGPGTRFEDPAATRERMIEVAEKLAEERRRRLREQQVAAETIGPTHRTDTGIILPGQAPAGHPVEQKGEAAQRPTILIPGRDF